VGTSGGAPTQIPAGYYTIEMNGPGACDQLPLLEIKGPGVDIFSDMTSGEVDYMSEEALFKPSSTYTWHNNNQPGVFYSFTTGPQIVNAAPTAQPVTKGQHGTVSSSSIVGSAATRGTIAIALDGGKAKVKAPSPLRRGRYRIAVDGVTTLLLRKGSRTIAVTRSATVTLAAGRWSIVPRPGAKVAGTFLVS
jgi:hypothetical protein